MEDQLITFETAKLAREKGFPQSEFTKVYWEGKQENVPFSKALYYKKLIEKDLLGNEVYEQLKLCSAPSQSLLQKWLRENHNWYCNAELNEQGKYIPVLTYIPKNQKDYWDESLPSFEDNLEFSLQEALKLIN